MDRKSHTWLKALSGKMNKQDIKELFEKIESIEQKFDRELADSVLEISKIKAEIQEDDILCAVKSFRDLGATDNQIKEVLVKNHRLSFTEAEKYL